MTAASSDLRFPKQLANETKTIQEEAISDQRFPEQRSKKSSGMDETDRLSYLPEIVIYNVMDFLPTKEVVRTSVLSKRWRRLRASYPCLDFDQTFFRNILAIPKLIPSNFVFWFRDMEERRDKFIRFVDENLLRFHEQGERVRKLKLFFTIFEPWMASLIDRWIGLATESMAEELHLQIPCHLNELYKLPYTVFAASSVKVLKLEELGLEPLSHQRTIEFRSLRKLSLVSVHVDASVFASIITSCPLIEKIELLRCSGMHEVHITGLHNLKEVSIVQEEGAIELHIEAPSLQKLSFGSGFFEYSHRKFSFSFIACQYLKELNLTGFPFSDQQFVDLLAKFPLLEVLHLAYCTLSKNVKIPNQHLRRLICICRGLEEGELEIITASPLAKWELITDLYSVRAMNSQSFCKLRNLVAKSENLKSLTLLSIFREISFTVEEVKDILLPSVPIIDCIELELAPFREVNYSAFLDGLFWSCHPKSLSIIFTDRESGSKFITVFADKFLHKLDSNLEHSGSVQAWQHELKDAEFYDGDWTALPSFTLHANLKW